MVCVAMRRDPVTPLAPVVSRSVYRSLLRLTANGAHPEVVPWSTLPDVQGALHASREKQAFVRQALVAAASDPFAVLRHSAVLKQALRPTSLPEELPVLAEHACILPGEACRFVLHSANDLLLVQHATAAEGRFVHVAKSQGRASQSVNPEAATAAGDAVGADTVGSVISIQTAKMLPFGRIVLDGIAGPRCRFDMRRAADRSLEPTPRREDRLLRVAPRLYIDVPLCAQHAAATEALRLELAARLLQPACTEVLRIVGMVPPVQCAERLSLFLCALLLHSDDIDRRVAVMSMRSTQRRLEFCKAAMDAAEWGPLCEAKAAVAATDEKRATHGGGSRAHRRWLHA